MVTDYQIGMSALEDLLSVSGDYIDIFKFAVGTSRLYERSLLERKISALRDANIRPFLGGQFQEYVLHTLGLGAMEAHLKEASSLGFEMVEISNNVVDVSDETRQTLLAMVGSFGMSPVGEVGDKVLHTDARKIVDAVNEVLNEGADLAMVEGQELMLDGEPNIQLINLLRESVDHSKVMFELSTPRVGSTSPEIYKGKRFLIKMFGPDVNLGNVACGDVMETETTRLGLGSAGPLSFLGA